MHKAQLMCKVYYAVDVKRCPGYFPYPQSLVLISRRFAPLLVTEFRRESFHSFPGNHKCGHHKHVSEQLEWQPSFD